MLFRERQQRDVARLLDGRRQAMLVRGTDASQAARHDLAALGHELAEHAVVFVVDVFDLFGAELADLLAPEKLRPPSRGGPPGPRPPPPPPNRGRSPLGRSPLGRGRSLGADCSGAFVSSAIYLPLKSVATYRGQSIRLRYAVAGASGTQALPPPLQAPVLQAAR